jgi:hypothetical protein
MARIDDEQTPDVQPVTEAELDLTVLDALDRHVTVAVIYRTIDGDGRQGTFVDSANERFPVRGSLPVPTMTAFLRLETRINNALAFVADDDLTPEKAAELQMQRDRELEATMEEAHDRILGLIVEKTPSAFRLEQREVDDETVTVRPSIELDTSQILVLLGWIAGDISVADAIARGLTAGATGARSEAEIAAEAGAADGDAGEAAEAAPFGSSARS